MIYMSVERLAAFCAVIVVCYLNPHSAQASADPKVTAESETLPRDF